MVISSNYNLIPYPDHHYQVLPYIQDNQDNIVANQERGQRTIERHNLIQRPHSDIKAHAIHFDFSGYNNHAKQSLQYSDADQLGLLVDIYA
jgi:hypothetical protein